MIAVIVIALLATAAVIITALMSVAVTVVAQSCADIVRAATGHTNRLDQE